MRVANAPSVNINIVVPYCTTMITSFASILFFLSTICIATSPLELNDPFLLQTNLETGFNNQILAEYEAFYVYEHMAAYFSRPDVGLLGFAKLFRKFADEEIEHARKFTEFINKRSGRVILKHVMLPAEMAPPKFRNIQEAVDMAIAKEIHVSKLIQDLHRLSGDVNDAQAQHFLDDFLTEQVNSIVDWRVIRSRLALDPSAVFLMDKELR